MLRKSVSTERSVLQMPVRRNSPEPQPPASKGKVIPKRALLAITREKIVTIWLNTERSERCIANEFEIGREEVEFVLKCELRARLAERRAA